LTVSFPKRLPHLTNDDSCLVFISEETLHQPAVIVNATVGFTDVFGYNSSQISGVLGSAMDWYNTQFGRNISNAITDPGTYITRLPYANLTIFPVYFNITWRLRFSDNDYADHDATLELAEFPGNYDAYYTPEYPITSNYGAWLNRRGVPLTGTPYDAISFGLYAIRFHKGCPIRDRVPSGCKDIVFYEDGTCSQILHVKSLYPIYFPNGLRTIEFDMVDTCIPIGGKTEGCMQTIIMQYAPEDFEPPSTEIKERMILCFPRGKLCTTSN